MNRHFILIGIIMAFFSTVTSAQKNTWMMNISGEYDNKKYSPVYSNYYTPATSTSLESWALNTGIGYLIGSHFMIGVDGGINSREDVAKTMQAINSSYGSAFYTAEHKYKTTGWRLGLFCRYSTNIASRFFVYGQFYATKYGFDTKEETYYTGNNNNAQPYTFSNPEMPSGRGFVVGILPVVGVNLFKGFGLHVDCGGIIYNSYRTSDAVYSNCDLRNIKITFGQHFTFGIHKVFGWKKLNNVAPVTK